MPTFLLLLIAYIAFGVALSCGMYVYTDWDRYRGVGVPDRQFQIAMAGIFWPIGIWAIICLSFFRYTKRWKVVRKG